jgi:hypothetical protein
MSEIGIYRQSRSFGQNPANKKGPAGAAKGDPASGVSAPVIPSTEKASTAFAEVPLHKSLSPAMTSGINARPLVSIYLAALHDAGLGHESVTTLPASRA